MQRTSGNNSLRYDGLAFRPAGNVYITVEIGDENDILLNFRVQALNQLIQMDAVEGIKETIVTIRSLGIIFDPRITREDALIGRIKELDEEAKKTTKLPSRQIRVPVWFDDPWSVECAKAFWDCWDHGYGGGCTTNLEFLAKFNRMTVEQFIDNFVRAEVWVTWTGFTPGSHVATALDPAKRVTAPKYKVPRTRTPPMVVCIGGQSVGINTGTPGGYYLIGRTPWNVYEPEQKNRIFKGKPTFIRPTDRIIYYAIDGDKFRRIRQQVENGKYDYASNISEGTFDLEEYSGTLGKQR